MRLILFKNLLNLWMVEDALRTDKKKTNIRTTTTGAAYLRDDSQIVIVRRNLVSTRQSTCAFAATVLQKHI